MSGLTNKIIIFAIFCIGLLSIQPANVSAFRSKDLALRSFPNLKTDGFQDLRVPLNIAPSPATIFDPNKSEKRRVRRGSDPIHNKTIAEKYHG
ncbi:hypothetical protein BUALT_Bualt07G0062400 [Buddleja alternifolia]|uniref:Uncharacterized protein n=1 Tax=Buddleja alternifolia TaxID=168488 RepID=A0AAV6XGD8_9LAMI|nr:hypothetical protein BUALT_Bualt07G0062400 [Buddleja alternifolia]